MSDLSRHSACVPETHRPPVLRLWISLICLAGLTSVCTADEPAQAYGREITEIQSDLDAGRIAIAKKKLASTDESRRNFEYEYLNFRALAAAGEGTAAPDGIHLLAKPAVETRYGVLNPVARQVGFICRDGSLRVCDLSLPDADPLVQKHPQESAVFTGVFSRDGQRFFSGHQNGDVLIRDTAAWKIQQSVSLGEDWPVRELAVAPDGSAFVGESKTELQLWSLTDEAPRKIAALGARYNFGEGLAFSPTGDLIATGGMFDIILHNAKTGDPIRSMRHASYTMGLEFSPDGKWIASATRGNVNKFLAIFDVTQNTPMFNAGPFGNYIVGLSFTSDGKRIAATGCDNVVRLFDAATGEIMLSLKRSGCSAQPAFSRDGRLLGWNEANGFLFIDLEAALKPKL